MSDFLIVNRHTIRFNPFWNEWQLSHPEIGPCGEYTDKEDAIEDARKG